MVKGNDGYAGREQTLLKHRVLKTYLTRWILKLGSVSGRRAVRLWYVDCFGGPWRARDEQVEDTSSSIALSVLNAGLAQYSAQPLEVGAVFVERDPDRFTKMRENVEARAGGVVTHCLEGAFEDRLPDIERLLGTKSAFVFVDPTGWKGMGMGAIAPLIANGKRRDVVVNVMYDHINRFKGMSDVEWLREQLNDFFGGVDDTELADLDERQLLQLYRARLKEHSDAEYALELAVPKPTSNRTYFHLVLACRHPDGVELFRDVEDQVLGTEAGELRHRARSAQETKKTQQASFDFPGPKIDSQYRQVRDADLVEARQLILRMLDAAPEGVLAYDSMWPVLLEELHIRRAAKTGPSLNAVLAELRKDSVVEFRGLAPRGRVLRKGMSHLVALAR